MRTGWIGRELRGFFLQAEIRRPLAKGERAEEVVANAVAVLLFRKRSPMVGFCLVASRLPSLSLHKG